MHSNEIIQAVKQLVQVNRDAASGFQTAAEKINNSELETLFTGYAKQHEKFQQELQTELHHSGSDGAAEGSGLHRRWMSFKSALSGHSAGSVLAACEDEEQSAEAAYAEAGKTDFTGRLGSLIAKQEQQIKETHKHLCRLLGEVKDGVEFQANK